MHLSYDPESLLLGFILRHMYIGDTYNIEALYQYCNSKKLETSKFPATYNRDVFRKWDMLQQCN